jgi:hypothetical protein
MAQNGPARVSARASDRPSPTFALRLGIIRDARLVLERMLPLDAPIDIGAGTPLDLDGIPAQRLFSATANGLELAPAIRHRTRTRHGDATATLTHGDRGRITLSDVTILYQVVPAPPVARLTSVGAPLDLDFRPRWLGEEEIPFVQSLALWSALGMLLGVFVATAPAPRTASIDTLPDYLATIPAPVHLPSAPAPEVDPIVEDDDAVAEVHEVPARPEPMDIDDAPPAETAPRRTAMEEALAQETRREQLAARFAKAGLISTSGETDWSIDHEDVFDGMVIPGENAPRGEIGLRRSRTDGVGGGPLGTDIDLDDYALPTGGASGLAGDPELVVVTTAIEPLDGRPTETGDWIPATLRRYRGQVQYCYERALKTHPELAGRIELGVDVQDGRVVDVWTASDGIGQGVAACIEDRVKLWRFGDANSGSFSWPYIFRPAGE